jgi:hypothetical protein
MLSCGMPKMPETANTELEDIIAMEEMLDAVKKRKTQSTRPRRGMS